MGDTHHDPTDHLRTTDQHAGEWLIDVYLWPGFSLLGLGIFALIGIDATLAYRHVEFVVTFGVIAIAATAAGLAWIRHERNRIRRIETRWHAEHPHIGPERACHLADHRGAAAESRQRQPY